MLKKLLGNNKFFVIACISVLLTATIFYHTYKSLPEGTSYEGAVHYVENVELLYDLTYQKHNEMVTEQTIFNRIHKVIDEAEEFIILDMFLFNGHYGEDETFPSLSDELAQSLLNKKQHSPHIQIVFITDKVNTTYGSHRSEWLEKLRNNGIEVIETNLNKLRDSNPLYSSIWRAFFQWFGQSGTGWLPNPFGETAPDITIRSYLNLLNIKANHRKVVVTDQTAIISSANPHDASAYHSNMAFEVNGNIIHDIVESEQAVASYSGGISLPSYNNKQSEKGNIRVQLLTEGRIYKHILEDIKKTSSGDEIWMAMFYLADRGIVKELLKASSRGADVNLILDPNENAFGQQKIGLPNRPVALELIEKSKGSINIRWYRTDEEQFHPKTLFIKGKDVSTVIGGSANFTKRNLDDLNLETNLKITAPSNENIMKELDEYFSRLWNNEGAEYTLAFHHYKDESSAVKKVLYRIQKLLRFTTY